MLKKTLILLPLLVVSCASVVSINSFRDPDYSNKSFNTLLVVANVANRSSQEYFENMICYEFKKYKLDVEPSVQFILPTRNNNKNIAEIIEKYNFSGIIKVTFTKTGTKRSELTDGETIEKPYFYSKIEIIDSINSKTAWVCDGYNGGNAFDSFDEIYRIFLIN